MTDPRPTAKRHNPLKALVIAVTLIAAGISMIFLTRSEGTPQREKRETLVPVKVAAAVKKAVPVQLRAVGTVEAYARYPSNRGLTANWSGPFSRGQDVKKGICSSRSIRAL
jgi:multidrug efflux pump subunit AcrA (membrane-fusion protein)